MKRLVGSLQVMALLIYLVACNSATSTIIPTPTNPSTSTTIPTATETSTPFPTNTSLPSPTPACPPQPDSQATLNSVQEKTAALVPGAKVIWYDNFNCEDLSYGWGLGGFANPTANVSVSNGIVTFSAQKVEDAWDGFGRPYSLGDQKGFLVLFRYQARTEVGLFFHTGTWWKSDYRRWGLGIVIGPSEGYWEGWYGSNSLPSYFSRKVLQPNKWYYLLDKLGKNGEVTMRVWEKDNPTNYVDSKKEMPSNSIGHKWAFLVQIGEGILEMDEYQELSFDTP